jgi:hypothetical protein
MDQTGLMYASLPQSPDILKHKKCLISNFHQFSPDKVSGRNEKMPVEEQSSTGILIERSPESLHAVANRSLMGAWSIPSDNDHIRVLLRDLR